MFCARSRPTNKGNREQKTITKKLAEFHNQFVLLTMIISTIDKKQRAWPGRTLRHGDLLPALVIEGRVEGRRPPGRPRTGILDRIKNGSSYKFIKKRAFERKV